MKFLSDMAFPSVQYELNEISLYLHCLINVIQVLALLKFNSSLLFFFFQHANMQSNLNIYYILIIKVHLVNQLINYLNIEHI